MGVAYLDGRTGEGLAASMGGNGGCGQMTRTDRLRVQAKGEGAGRRIAYGRRPSHNRAYQDCGLYF